MTNPIRLDMSVKLIRFVICDNEHRRQMLQNETTPNSSSFVSL
jgi:hypothetical protein